MFLTFYNPPLPSLAGVLHLPELRVHGRDPVRAADRAQHPDPEVARGAGQERPLQAVLAVKEERDRAGQGEGRNENRKSWWYKLKKITFHRAPLPED